MQSDVHALSGGMRQRAMVARALVRRPELLVLDEPTSSLDPASQETLLEVLARLRAEEGLTMLFVCHDVSVAARYASHVALFHDGIVETGPRELLLDDGVLARVYGLGLRVRIDDRGHATLEVGDGVAA
jgi:ABC-type cobalamin/Fe3+-siderophores transport system ATPase subunit